MTPRLQPLRIPPGWVVAYNDFREVDPSPASFAEDMLREDLLQLVYTRGTTPRIVDLGWNGGFAEGHFTVVCVEPDFRGETLDCVRTRERAVAVEAVERMLVAYSGIPRGTHR